MSNSYLISILIVLIVSGIGCTKRDIHRRVEELKNRYRRLYGEVTRENTSTRADEDKLSYPRGDQQKLSELGQLWCDYYECLARLNDQLTPDQRLPSRAHMVYKESVAILQCDLCVAPDEKALIWSYAASVYNLTFITLSGNDRTVTDGKNLTVYHVTEEDSGVYRCQFGCTIGGLAILEVVDDEENYTIVKPSPSRGPYASPPMIVEKVLKVFSLWSPWTECSVCGTVGRRRKYGICYVKLHRNYIINSSKKILNEDYNNSVDEAAIALFEEFPDGVPCRSQLLPRAIRHLPNVVRRPSEIMIAMCKVKCQDIIFEVRLGTGKLLERANNSAGIYSLAQELPKQPPLLTRDTIVTVYGQPFVMRCPGTTLRDVPVLWRMGNKRVIPRHLDKSSGGRLHLNARDHLVFTQVLYADANLYSCWQRDALAATIKLIVWGGSQMRWNHHATLSLLVITAGVMLHVAERVLRDRRYVRT